MKISERDKADRPREKLAAKGSKALSDFELLQVIIGSGVPGSDVTAIARAIRKLLDKDSLSVTLEQLTAIKGVSLAHASKILACFELSQRYQQKDFKVLGTEDAVLLLHDIRDKKQEYFVTLTLDGANRLIAKRTITIGTVNASLVHPREVFADAITDRAAAIIVAHNHPSGSLTPSKADLEVTRRLKESGELLGIQLLDHLIVSPTSYTAISI